MQHGVYLIPSAVTVRMSLLDKSLPTFDIATIEVIFIYNEFGLFSMAVDSNSFKLFWKQLWLWGQWQLKCSGK